ncbi:hypothetical protein C5167_013089 [Papaver somniferum]|uniref:Uncharacterized protein n=1 Tax=Papaver somniferum TaxID=3469 RepID=A0A4Y7J3K9_PAPSO|nr:hypothetical protein C5167_013089 [Papaver somniferum]
MAAWRAMGAMDYGVALYSGAIGTALSVYLMNLCINLRAGLGLALWAMNREKVIAAEVAVRLEAARLEAAREEAAREAAVREETAREEAAREEAAREEAAREETGEV